MELLKSITCEKPRRARQAAAAARFFDESVRNSYARRATTPQTASWRQGEFRAEARKRWRRCVTLVRTPVASVSGAQQKGHGGEGNFARQGEKDPADASLLWRTPLASVSGAQQKGVSGAQHKMPYVSEPPSRVKRNIRLTAEVGVCSAAPTTF